MTIFGIDASSGQGTVNWAQADASTDFGAEKVTEGANYENPFWSAAKAAMLDRAKATGFVPVAYFFMDATPSGAAQAEWFALKAGDLAGFGIAVDLERAPDGSPTLESAHEAVARLRQLYPHHPVGGYAPHWYTANGDLTFFDWTWASSYVSGQGAPAALYASVPGAWWAAYGGKVPLLLQFTDKATVPGVGTLADCSAFRGTAAELAARILPGSHVSASSHPDASGPLIILRPGDPPAWIPLLQAPSLLAAGDTGTGEWIAAAEPLRYPASSLLLVGDSGAIVKVTHWAAGKSAVSVHPLSRGVRVALDLRDIEAVSVERADKMAGSGASIRLIAG